MTAHIERIFRGYRGFQRDPLNLEDAERTGMPQMSLTEENITGLRKILNEDKRVILV